MPDDETASNNPVSGSAPAESTTAASPATTSTTTTTTPKAGRTRRRAASRPAGPPPAPSVATFQPPSVSKQAGTDPSHEPATAAAASPSPVAAAPVALVFQPPDTPPAPRDEPAAAEPAPRSRRGAANGTADSASDDDASAEPAGTDGDSPSVEGTGEERTSNRRRRSRGGRNRRKSSTSAVSADAEDDSSAGDDVPPAESPVAADDQNETASITDDVPSAEPLDTAEPASSSRRRRRRRSTSDDEDETAGDAKASTKSDAITKVEGSTRVEAKKQRRREGRDAGRRRAPILSESEFLARREAVDRVMAIRQRGGTTQIAVLEDGVLVEHYAALESQTSMIGNVYLGRVQNVLPSMEAAFVDIGKGRNAVLYAGEVDWTLRGDLNQPRRIENALKAGQTVLVQVTKDPVGHKGGRLTSQISLPGRYLVYVPGGGTNGISRKLPDIERNRLKAVLKDIVPEEAGVIIRTAAEGASEDELKRDVAGLTARWDDIEKKTKSGQAPQLMYAEPDTTIKVVRDLFTEDFTTLVVSGDDAWDMVDGYVSHVAPDLAERLERFTNDDLDLFDNYRVDEQIAKALERKVWLPSGGSLVIDRTEAMTVVDVNTGKFTGAGGSLEQTVTKNNLEAAEEIVRQLRLRDIGGIIVIDFIDMVLEENRDLVLRRLVECLGRDRTRHQVAEVTSLGLVQMTRKRISTGLLEAFSTPCETCNGRGVVIMSEPVGANKTSSGGSGRSGSSPGNSDGDTSQSVRSNGAGRRNGSRAVKEPKVSTDAPKVSTEATDVSTVSTDATDISTDHEPEKVEHAVDASGELAITP